jgi:rod shape determining protein RodA
MAIGVVVLAAAGAPSRQLAAVGCAAVVASVLVLSLLPAVGVDLLKPYQVQRLTGFISP